MKIRKLILKAKLQQIEKQYQYVFIYHCSGLTNPQWRQLKDFLYKTNSKTFFQPKRRQKQLDFFERGRVSEHSSNHRSAASTWCEPTAYLFERQWSAVAQQPLTRPLNSKLALLSGPFCIFYLRSQEIINTHQSNGYWSQVVKKIDSLEYKTNLVLLYAQIKSTLVNHIDIKQALNLETRSVYQHFLWSTQYPAQTLDFCLYQNRNCVPSILDTFEENAR
jgi:hypothetical protein